MNIVDLNHWTCWKFGRAEYRLCGFIPINEKQMRCIISEPVVRVDSKLGLILTENNIYFKPVNRLEDVNKMEMMYSLGRWCELHEKASPVEVTNMIVEDLINHD